MWRGAVLALLAALTGSAVVEPARAAKVAKPRFVRNIATGETGWFASPGSWT